MAKKIAAGIKAMERARNFASCEILITAFKIYRKERPDFVYFKG